METTHMETQRMETRHIETRRMVIDLRETERLPRPTMRRLSETERRRRRRHANAVYRRRVANGEYHATDVVRDVAAFVVVSAATVAVFYVAAMAAYGLLQLLAYL